jgi:predicted TIM-barrel fold metal-dependent hydrolase
MAGDINAFGASPPPVLSDEEWRSYFDEGWLAQRREEIIDPDLAIIDPHQHFWPWSGYGVEQLLTDLGSGHRIVATVHVESELGHCPDGPSHLRPVGETALLAGIFDDAPFAGREGPRVCAGIVGQVDLTLTPQLVDECLEAHIRAGNGRFRGIRLRAYSSDPVGATDRAGATILADPGLHAGFARLSAHNLTCDVMVLHPQLGELAEFAVSFPETQFILNHLGGPLGRAEPYSGHPALLMDEWRAGMREVARCPNVAVKLGGLANKFYSGWRFDQEALPPSSEDLAEAHRPYVETAIELFGAARCMFESDFPADKVHCDYAVLWNAFKRLAAGCSVEEKMLLFRGTAQRVYRLGVPASESAASGVECPGGR